MEEKQILQEKRYFLPYHFLDLYSDEHKLLHHVPYIYRIEKALDLGQEGDAIDVGCGDGRLIYEGQKNKKYKKFIGIDYSENALSFAKIINKNAFFYKIDLTNDKSISDIGKFKNIFCLETLEHIQINKIDVFLKNCSDLIDNNGIAIFSVPSSYYPCEEKHYQHFSRNSLNDLLNRYFNVIEITGLENQEGINKFIIDMYFRISKIFFPLRHIKIFNYLSKIYLKNYIKISEGETKTCSGLIAICKKKTFS